MKYYPILPLICVVAALWQALIQGAWSVWLMGITAGLILVSFPVWVVHLRSWVREAMPLDKSILVYHARNPKIEKNRQGYLITAYLVAVNKLPFYSIKVALGGLNIVVNDTWLSLARIEPPIEQLEVGQQGERCITLVAEVSGESAHIIEKDGSYARVWLEGAMPVSDGIREGKIKIVGGDRGDPIRWTPVPRTFDGA